jgi:hypothetical protein
MGNANPGLVSSQENSTRRGDLPLGLNIAIASGKKNLLDYVVKFGVKQDIDLAARGRPGAATTAPNFTTYDTENVAAAQDDTIAAYAGGGAPASDLAAAQASGVGPTNRQVPRKAQGSFLSRLLNR